MNWEPRQVSDGRQLPLHIEFADIVPREKPIAFVCADAPPCEVLEALLGGDSLLIQGDFRRIDAVWRYLAHRKDDLAPRVMGRRARKSRIRERARAIRACLYRLLVEVAGDALANVSDSPDLSGLREWVDAGEQLQGGPFLLPFRRLQRIISDMRRQSEGLEVAALGARITVLPSVYVPWDQSVVDLLAENPGEIRGAKALDMGTGTGVLALVAAKLGARRVVATDANPRAVENARANADLLGFRNRIDVREAGDLFAPVEDERFDIVIFNAPWMEGSPRTLYDTAIYDEDHRLLRRFIAELPRHLKPEGVGLLLICSTSDLQGVRLGRLIRESAADAGLQIRERACRVRVGRAAGSRERVLLLELASHHESTKGGNTEKRR